jgi:hypothetical protein
MSPGTAQPARLSRWLYLVAGALALVILPMMSAGAEEARWQIQRREDLGFEIEMPGEPMEHTEPPEDLLLTMVNLMFANDDALFAVNHQEYAKPFTLKGEIELLRLAMQEQGTPIERETAISINGIAGVEAITERAIMWVVSVQNYRILVAAFGYDREVHTNSAVRRFLASFKLLPRRH